MCDTTRVRYEDGTVCSEVYGYLRCVLVSQQSAGCGHNQCGLPVRVTSAGYELALGGSQTCNIWLPNFFITLIGNRLLLTNNVCPIFRPQKANLGDVLVLTKPLGTHIACIATQWMNDDKEKWNRLKAVLTEDEAHKAFQRALASMTRLNLKGGYSRIRALPLPPNQWLYSSCFFIHWRF